MNRFFDARNIGACSVVALLMAPVVIGAQAESAIDTEGSVEVVGAPVAQLPAGTVSCFDYYDFGSVQAHLTMSAASAVSGAPIAVSGTLVNSNPYPIVGGNLFIKVFRERGTTNDGNGPDVVDQFLALDEVVIPANSSIPVAFEWMVPSSAISGTYRMATFFTTQRKFNLLGLSFTDDVVGNTIVFDVSGERDTNVSFDKTGVTIQGKPYTFAAFPPQAGSEPITISSRIRNTTNAEQKAEIEWTVYQWDSLLRENAVQQEKQTITVPAGGSAVSEITVTDTQYPVYYAVGTLSWRDSTSIIGVRFGRDDVNRTRINFPGITSFPLRKDQSVTLFSCLHNAGEEGIVPGGRLELSLEDRAGTPIYAYTYAGDVSSSMMGVAESFVPQRNYDVVTLKARLYSGEEFVDEVAVTYDCAHIDPSQCAGEDVAITAGPFMPTDSGSLAIVAGIVIILGMGFVFWRRGREADAPSDETPLDPLNQNVGQ